ncbi:sigma-E factor negative regulatory protein [Burkholderiaceae bacterium UC74_6]
MNGNLQSLSDLADGRASEQQLDALLRQWSEDEGLRRDWEALQLGGEALRSPDLAAPAQSSAQLLAALRQRMAAEPVVLQSAQARRSSRWLPPMGVAAGFVLLALLTPRLFLPLTQPQRALTEADSSQALVAVPGSGALDSTNSFVQTIVAPQQPGQVSSQAMQASERLLSLPPPYSPTGAASEAVSGAASGAAMP